MNRVSILAFTALLAGCSCSSSMNPVNWFDGHNKLQAVADQLTSSLAGEQVTVTKSGDQIKLTSSADYLYPSGGWQLRPGTPVLSKMVPTLRPLQHTTIMVNGYTDSQPVGPKLQSMGIMNNADLSLKRADAVASYFKTQGVYPPLLSANGYGSNDPVASNDTPEGRAKNRRVDIVLTGDGT